MRERERDFLKKNRTVSSIYSQKIEWILAKLWQFHRWVSFNGDFIHMNVKTTVQDIKIQRYKYEIAMTMSNSDFMETCHFKFQLDAKRSSKRHAHTCDVFSKFHIIYFNSVQYWNQSIMMHSCIGCNSNLLQIIWLAERKKSIISGSLHVSWYQFTAIIL